MVKVKAITREPSFLSLWVGVVVLCVIHLVVKDRSNLKRFIFLILYALNRTIILMIVVSIVFFPIDYFVFMKQPDYLSKGIKVGSILFKTIGYGYFYFILVRLVLQFNFSKQEK